METLILIALTTFFYFKLKTNKRDTPIIAAFIFGIITLIPIGYVLDAVLRGEMFSKPSEHLFIWALAVGCIGFWIIRKSIASAQANSREKINEINSKLANDIKHVTGSEYIKGQNIVDDLGWVKSKRAHSIEAAERQLKVQAAKKGANAITQKIWTKDSERYQAGVGPKGNPYYKSRPIFSGEAKAVVVAVNRHRTPSSPKEQKIPFKKIDETFIVIDGSNVAGSSGWSFDPISTLVRELCDSKYEFVIFFDNGIYRALKERNLIEGGQKIDDAIAVELNLPKNMIAITPVGEEADQYIIDLARRKSAAILSNDNFSDHRRANPWLSEDGRILKFQVVGNEILVPKLDFT